MTTAATILRKQTDAARRNRNNVKFVWLKKPIADFVAYSKGDEAVRRATFEDIRQTVEGLTADEENDVWRIRVVNQAELFKSGCLNFEVRDDDEDDYDNADESATIAKAAALRAEQNNLLGQPTQPSLQMSVENLQSAIRAPKLTYIGSKWGIHLRAPEIFSKLLKRGGARFVPLGQIAEIKRGVTSGCDAFFFPRDVTAEKLAEDLTDKEFKDRYGIGKKETETIRIVHAGDGSQHLIEAEYLEPEIHSVLGLDSVEIVTEKLKRKVLLLKQSKKALKGKRVLKYIEYGEREKFSEGSTVEGRVKTGREWYDVTQDERSNIVWAKAHQYRHLVWLNPDKLIVNNRMYDVFVSPETNAEALCAMLNSTIVAFSKNFYGRFVGKEGYLETSVLDAKMMFVPNANLASKELQEKLIATFNSMRKRKALPLVDVDSTDVENWTGELALADRQMLDDAVLELIGVSEANERKDLRNELYREITRLYRQIRVAEKKMQRFRSATARKGKQTAHSIAEEIWTELAPHPEFVTPLDFVESSVDSETINLPLGRAKIVSQSLLQPNGVQIGGEFIALGDAERSDFVKKLSDLQLHGAIRVPLSPEMCRKAVEKYDAQFEKTNELFRAEAATMTADENMQAKVVKELWKKLRNG